MLIQSSGEAVFAERAETGGATVEFEAFVRASLPGLLRYGHLLTGSPHDAADLVQTALEKAGGRWSRIVRQDADPLAYVRRSMANAHVSRWRRRRREVLLDELPDHAVSHPDRLDGEPVWQALAQLPPRQRAVLVLRYYEELSEAEIADVLGISAGTVKSQASKALAKLRTAMSAVEGRDR
ncbi:SigE family RNA polymerase sigma factor [Jiangella anatolica]|uniref:SigE family RNA polymerase sigma factor n=1 Tax=Jiangella anatolica TaxID=2670374 RepID=A0A2W2BG26_9ACTN|nr:SigE family RNA polymerase sigma factor [Jiangella anatolica]PZF79224.1 SigE family RNA polymerase sigma factor [Jiangella anatolica]